MRYRPSARYRPMKPLSIRLPDRHIAWLDQQAGDIDTRTAIIRRLIDAAIRSDQQAGAKERP